MAKLKTMTVKDSEGKDIVVGMLGAAGLPIYNIDGREVEQDLDILRSDLTKANGEAAARRVELKELKERTAPFDGMDAEKVKAALETVANLEAGKLLDANKVAELKKQIGDSYEANQKAVVGSLEIKIGELERTLSDKDGAIKRMLVKSVFDSSEFLKGTIYSDLREGAYDFFGKHFEVVPGENGDYQVVAKDGSGNNILSIARPGQVATPEEALEHIITNHPQSKHIIRASGAGGSGAQGGGGGGAKTTIQQLKEQLATAQANKNGPEVIRLTDAVFQAERVAAS